MWIKMEHSQEDKCCVGAEAPGSQWLATKPRHALNSAPTLPAETSTVPSGHHMLHKCDLRHIWEAHQAGHQHLLCAG